MCMLAQELDAEDVVSAVVQLQRIARVDLALVSAPPAQCPAHARSSTQWTDECPVLRDLAATGRHSTDAVGSRPRVIGLIRQGACPSQREQQDPSMRPSSSQQLGVGDCVSVKPKPSDSGGAKRLGRVQCLRSSGAVDVFYADGRVEERVGRDRLAPPSSKTRPTRRDGPRPRAGHEDELEEKAPAPAAAEAPRRARTETATAAAPTRRRQPTETSPHTARASQQKQPASSRRPRDSSDSVAYTHKQVTEIMDAITAADADAVAVKNSLSLLLRVIRTAPQVTAECLHEQNGELRLLATIRMHSAHAVLLCYGCVLMRKLCHLSVEAAELFVQHGIVTTVAQALQSFPEDAILQASACGCLAVLTQTSDVSKHEMLSMSEPSILDLVLASLDTHREYSNLTRQVQIYACEVLTELCDYGGPPTVGALIAHDPRRKTESPMELAVALTRQSMAREDKKVTCSFCSLLLCLASNSSAAAESLREFGAIPDISVVMAKYPVDEGIIRFSAAALREIAETSLSHSPSKTVHEKARVILDEDVRWDLPSDRAAGYKKNDRGGSRERKRERDSPIGVTNKRHSPGERPRSPPSSRMKGPSLSRSNSVIPDEDAVSDGRYGEAASGPPPRVSSDVMDMDQSMAELREFAQQLLKEEARISSLLAQTGSKSPGLNRMSFSDKLHKMIEIAESSMYERSLALSGSQGWADAATRTPPKTAEATPDDHAERPTSAARDVAKPTLDGAKASSSRKTPAVADAKIPASDAHTTPKMLSGYKKSRASTVGQKKQHKAHAKLGGVSPKADRKVVSKLDPNVRTPSIPFLEPLQVDSEKAPAKQDMEPSPQEERTKFSLTADTLSAMEDSPLKKEDRDTICEESIQEDIPVTASPLDIPSNLEEKEDEPVPEHIDVKHEEDGYHDEDASRSVHSLHDVEESPIIEEIGFASPQRNDVDSGRALANISQPLVSAQDDSYEDDQHTFEPEVSFVELVAPETIPADNLLQESKLTEEAFNAERTMTDSDVEAKGGAEFENFTVPAFLSDNEHRAASFDPDVRAPVSEETTADELVTPKVADETHDMWDRKSEEDEVGGPLHPSEVEPSYCPVSEQTSKDAEIDGFEFIELPARNQNDLATLLDWSTARDTCQEIVNQGIADALVEVEAMGGVYILLPREDTVSIDLTLGDNVDDSDVLSAAKNPADNNDDIVGIESRDVYSEEKTGDAPTIAASDAALLSALQNVVSSLTPSTVLAQEILSSTFEQLTERESISREIQDDAFRIQQAPSDDVAGEIGRIVASTIAGSLNSAVEQLRSLPLDADGSAEFSQSLNELVAVAVEAVAQRIRANDDLLVVPPVERFLPATTTPVPSLALSPSNNNDSELSHRSNTSRIDNDEQSSNHSDTSRTDEGHVSVQMAKAIQDSVNGIIAMSLVSMMEQFELSKLGQDGKDPESEGDDEAVATKQVEKDPSHINEPVLREENDAILPAKAAIAVGSYVNGLIALSVQNSVERALENGSPVGSLSELTVMAVNLHDAPREEHTLLDADTRKTDTSRSKGQKSITEPVETTPQENNAEEELSVQTVIAISRSIDGIIALSLEKTVKQLCLVDTSRADPEFDDSNEGISTFSLVDDTHEVPILPTHTDQVVDAEHAISEDVSLAIRRNISAVVAVALESVLQRLQGANDQLEQQTKEEGGQASTRIVEPHDLQPALPDDDLAGPREDGTEGIEQAPQQNFWGQDDATTELQDLPVAMAISIQRSVNAILMQALENVITDLTRESGMDKPGEDGELHSKPDEYNDTRDVETIPYDHAAVMTAIETFDQLHLPGDGVNQTSDRDAKGISIQMAIAVRWTVSGMIALAVENAIADTMLYSAAVDTPAEESPSDNYREPAPVADDIAKVISSDMAVAIRQTVDGIIERTTENVMSQIGAHTVQELVSQLVETTASLGELSLGGSAGDAVLTARKWAAPDQVSEEDESTLPIQMSLAIRQAVNGLIGLSLQAALEDAMGKTPAQLLLDPERDGSGEAVDSNLMEETRALSGSAQRSPTSVPLLNLPLASARTQLSDEKVEPSEEDQESVSVAAALAVSRTVTAVIAAGVEKMLDSMVNMGASLVAGQDTALASLTKTFSHDEHEHLTVDTGLKGTVSSSPEAVQDNEDNTQEETSGAQLSVRIPEGSEHAVNDGAYHHGAYEESLSPAMSVAVALSVRAILMEAVDKVSQRVTLPRAYKDDIEFVKAEVLETPQLENTADHLGYYRSLAHESDAVATALASVVNTMTAATLASISSTSEVHQDVVAAEADTKSQQEADPEVHDTMYQILHPISEATETPTHSITEPDELHTTSGKVFEAPEATVEEPQESSASASEDVVAATAAAAASIAVVSALSETVDAVEAESEYADDEFGDEQVTESVPEVTTDAAEEVAATEPAEVAATGEPSEVAAAVAEAVAAVSEAASEAEVAAAAEDLVSAVESAVRAAAEQQAVGETPVAAEEVIEAPEATVEEPQETSASASEDVVAATAAAAASIAVVSALSATVDAMEAESEYADDEFGDEQVTESVPEVTTDAAEEVAATEPAEVAAT
ncbi:hypothetical protein PR003_g2183, partial [Phytophthora rubi]